MKAKKAKTGTDEGNTTRTEEQRGQSGHEPVADQAKEKEKSATRTESDKKVEEKVEKEKPKVTTTVNEPKKPKLGDHLDIESLDKLCVSDDEEEESKEDKPKGLKRGPKPKGEKVTGSKSAKVQFQFKCNEKIAIWKLKQLGLWSELYTKYHCSHGYEVVTHNWAQSANAIMQKLGKSAKDAYKLGMSVDTYRNEIEQALTYCQLKLNEIEKRDASPERPTKRARLAAVASPTKAKRSYRKAVVYKTDCIELQHEPDMKHMLKGERIENRERNGEIKQCLCWFIAEVGAASSITSQYSSAVKWNDIPDETQRKILSKLELDLRAGKCSDTKVARATFFEFKEYCTERNDASSSFRPSHLYPSQADVAEFLESKRGLGKDGRKQAVGAAKHAFTCFMTLRSKFGMCFPTEFAGKKGLTATQSAVRKDKKAVSPRILWLLEEGAQKGCPLCAAACFSIVACLRIADARRCCIDWANCTSEYWSASCYDNKTGKVGQGHLIRVPLVTVSGYEWWHTLRKELERDSDRDYLFAKSKVAEPERPAAVMEKLARKLEAHNIPGEALDDFLETTGHGIRRFLPSIGLLCNVDLESMLVFGMWRGNGRYRSMPLTYSDSRLTKLMTLIKQIYGALKLWDSYMSDQLAKFEEMKFTEFFFNGDAVKDAMARLSLRDRTAARFIFKPTWR